MTMIEASLLTFSGKQGPTNGLEGKLEKDGDFMQLSDLTEKNFSELILSQFSLADTLATLEQGPKFFSLQAESTLLPVGKNDLLSDDLLSNELPFQGIGQSVADLFRNVESLTVGENSPSVMRDTERSLAKELSVLAEGNIQNRSVTMKATKELILSSAEKFAIEQEQKFEKISINMGQAPVLFSKMQSTEGAKAQDHLLVQTDNTIHTGYAQSESVNYKQPLMTQSLTMAKLSIDAPLNQAGWGDALTGKISWMMMENQQSAKITINPPELGPIEVKVKINNDQASIQFFAHHGDVREAIEDAMPKLKDMLNQNGINLGESNVSEQSLTQSNEQGELVNGGEHISDQNNDTEQTEPLTTSITGLPSGLVDQYV